jgi:hypothetical protein
LGGFVQRRRRTLPGGHPPSHAHPRRTSEGVLTAHRSLVGPALTSGANDFSGSASRPSDQAERTKRGAVARQRRGSRACQPPITISTVRAGNVAGFALALLCPIVQERTRTETGMGRSDRDALIDHIAIGATSALVPIGLLAPAGWLLGFLAADLLAEMYRDRRCGSDRPTQSRSATARASLRSVAAVAGLAATQDRQSAVIFGFAVLACVQISVVGLVHLQTQLAKYRTLPFITRNIDLADLRIPAPPGRSLLSFAVATAKYGTSTMAITFTVAAVTGRPVIAVVAAAAGLSASVGSAAALFAHARRNRYLADRRSVINVIRRQVATFQPRLILYALSHPTDRATSRCGYRYSSGYQCRPSS